MKLERTIRIFNRIKSVVITEFPYMFRVKIATCPDAEAEHLESPRQYAHTFCQRLYDEIICVAPAIEELPAQYIRGLLWHEFGHLIAGPESSEKEADESIYALFGVRIMYDDTEGLNLQYVE